jgi:hypothetical protein
MMKSPIMPEEGESESIAVVVAVLVAVLVAVVLLVVLAVLLALLVMVLPMSLLGVVCAKLRRGTPVAPSTPTTIMNAAERRKRVLIRILLLTNKSAVGAHSL